MNNSFHSFNGLPATFCLLVWTRDPKWKLTNATWLGAAPAAVAFTEPGRRADQDERRGAAEGDLRLVDEASSLPETALWSSRVATKLGCEHRQQSHHGGMMLHSRKKRRWRFRTRVTATTSRD